MKVICHKWQKSPDLFILMAMAAMISALTSYWCITYQVIYVPHGANKDRTTFVQLTTESGRDVKVTPNHILPAGACGTSLPLIYASAVLVGNCVQTVFGQEKVSTVDQVQGEGVYTIVTNEEFIVVNGIIASPFGANHMLANLYYNVHRFIYASAPSLLTVPYLHSANEVSVVT